MDTERRKILYIETFFFATKHLHEGKIIFKKRVYLEILRKKNLNEIIYMAIKSLKLKTFTENGFTY